MKYRGVPRQWVIILLLSFAYLLVYVHRMCPAVLAQDLIETFNTSGAMVGLMASAYFYPYAVMQIPSGIIADKLGPRLLVTLCMCMASIGSLFFFNGRQRYQRFYGTSLSGVWTLRCFGTDL